VELLINVNYSVYCTGTFEFLFGGFSKFFKGVSKECISFFESLPVKSFVLCSIVLILASISKLFVGVVLNAPSADLMAEFREVLIRFIRCLGAFP